MSATALRREEARLQEMFAIEAIEAARDDDGIGIDWIIDAEYPDVELRAA